LVLFAGPVWCIADIRLDEDEIQKQAMKLGPGSAHPCTPGEVRLELEEFLLDGDCPIQAHARRCPANNHIGRTYSSYSHNPEQVSNTHL